MAGVFTRLRRRVVVNNRRVAGRAVVAVAATALGGAGLVGPATHAHASGQVFNVVTDYQADNIGTKDSTLQVQQAINDAQAAGPDNIVFFPAGTYWFYKQITGGTSVSVGAGNSVILEGDTLNGDGSPSSHLIEDVGKNLLNVGADGSTVEDLWLDARAQTSPPAPNASSSQQAALVVPTNNVTVEYSYLYGGANTYAVYFPGPPDATQAVPDYDTGNTVSHVVVNDQWNRDGFSFSFQQNGLIENVNHTGSRLALFVDKDTQVLNYTYTPSGLYNGKDQQGFWITAPSDNVTIDHFTTNGNGGTLGSGGQSSSNITISNEVFNNPGYHLTIGEVKGLTISNCNFGPAATTNPSSLTFITNHQATNVVVQNCTSLPVVRFAQPSSQPGTVQAEFDNNTYPAFTPGTGQGSFTFQTNFGGPTDFTVNNGTFSNCSGGFFHGTNTTFAVNSLSGYPCSADAAPTAPTLNVDKTSGPEPLTVNASVSGSTDVDTTPIAWYQFDWGDLTHTPRQAPGATPSDPNCTSATACSHTYSAPGTYTLTAYVIDSAGLNSSKTQQITVNPSNLVGNSGFEGSGSGSLSGWKAGAGSTLSLSSTAHTGSFSAAIQRASSQGRALLRDAPAWNSNTTGQTTCFISAWVQASSGVSKVYLHTIQMQGTTNVASNIYSVKNVAGSWVKLSSGNSGVAIAGGGGVLKLNIYAPLAVGQQLLVDDVSESCQ